MTGSDIVSLRPFVPAKEFAVAKQFYLDLGWNQLFGGDEVAAFELDGQSFLLQNFYVEQWAGNFMMQLTVRDVDATWAHLESLGLAAKYPGIMMKAPALQPWGMRVAYLSDPSGVLWHIAEATR